MGLVGYGAAGSAFHAPLIAALPELELAAVVTSDSERADEVAVRYPGARVTPDTSIFSSIGIDVAVVATPNSTHVAIAAEMIDQRIATVIDKPLATSSADALGLIAHAKKAGVPITCYMNRRWDGDFRTTRTLIEGGDLGSIVRFESRFERWRPQIKPGWKENPTPGGGVLFDLGPHLIDQAIQLFGAPSSQYSEIRHVRANARVDDSAFLALTHDNGTTSHLSMSAVAASPGPRFRVLGTDAGYSKRGFDPQEAQLRAGVVPGGDDWGEEPSRLWGNLCRGDERSPVPTLAGDYQQFYRELARFLRGEGPLPVDPQDCVVTLRVIEQALAGRDRGSAPGASTE